MLTCRRYSFSVPLRPQWHWSPASRPNPGASATPLTRTWCHSRTFSFDLMATPPTPHPHLWLNQHALWPSGQPCSGPVSHWSLHWPYGRLCFCQCLVDLSLPLSNSPLRASRHFYGIPVIRVNGLPSAHRRSELVRWRGARWTAEVQLVQ